MADQSSPVGWLEFFFEGYLPESPCPPGCRHRHSSWRGQTGSVCSEPTSPSYYTGGVSTSTIGEEDSVTIKCREMDGHFSPIPMLLQRRSSDPYCSDRSRTSSHSPVGYPEDGTEGLLVRGSSEEELKHIDNLISDYNEKLTESECELKSVAGLRHPVCMKDEMAPIKSRQDMKTDLDFDIQQYQLKRKPRPSLVAECLLAKCHFMFCGELNIDDVTYKIPLQSVEKPSRRTIKSTCDVSIQCTVTEEHREESDFPLLSHSTKLDSPNVNTTSTDSPQNSPLSLKIASSMISNSDSGVGSDKTTKPTNDTSFCSNTHISPKNSSPEQHFPCLAHQKTTGPQTTEESLTASQSDVSVATLRPPSEKQTKSRPAFLLDFTEFGDQPEGCLSNEQQDLYEKVSRCFHAFNYLFT